MVSSGSMASSSISSGMAVALLCCLKLLAIASLVEAFPSYPKSPPLNRSHDRVDPDSFQLVQYDVPVCSL
jgi:hypothetical protein